MLFWVHHYVSCTNIPKNEGKKIERKILGFRHVSNSLFDIKSEREEDSTKQHTRKGIHFLQVLVFFFWGFVWYCSEWKLILLVRVSKYRKYSSTNVSTLFSYKFYVCTIKSFVPVNAYSIIWQSFGSTRDTFGQKDE